VNHICRLTATVSGLKYHRKMLHFNVKRHYYVSCPSVVTFQMTLKLTEHQNPPFLVTNMRCRYKEFCWPFLQRVSQLAMHSVVL